jgi:LacI family transcriptional regulator
MAAKRRVLVLLNWNDPAIFQAIGAYARDAGWHLDTRLFFDAAVPHGWRGDGMIVSSGARPDLQRFIRRQGPRQPVVIIGANNPGLRAPIVASDNHAVGRLAAAHFLERGHRHFAWYTPAGGTVANLRRDGFGETALAAGCAFHPLETRLTDWPRRRQWLSRRLRELPRPLALFALDDPVAAEAIECCMDEGWRVPEDVAVMGVGNIETACQCSHVPITSVALQEDRVARRAAELLDALMRGEPTPVEESPVPPLGVVVRRSTDFVAVTHPGLRRALQFMEQHLRESITMELVAHAAGVSQRALYYLFRKELRCTPADLLLRQRMHRARGLLVETDQTIGEVAAACGLLPLRTINRCFWRVERMSPRAWRRAQLAWRRDRRF